MKVDVEKLVALIEEADRDSDFSGVISVFSHGAEKLNRAYGFRNYRDSLENNTETRFGMASGTKLFTALGIGVLIDRGLLTLGSTMSEIDTELSGFIDVNATVLDLLTHTSGVYDYYDEELVDDFDSFYVDIPWYKLETPSDYLPLFRGNKMKFAPGRRFSYSNGGYVLLGIITEKVSGRRYCEFVEETVLRPAGMTRSGFFAFNELPENTADGLRKGRKTSNIYNLPIRGAGDGGMYTTTGDLLSFWDSLRSHRILSSSLTNKFLGTYHEFNERNGYGCGICKSIDNNVYRIVGSDAGVGFESRMHVDEKMVINVLCNVTDGEELVRQAIREYFAKAECR